MARVERSGNIVANGITVGNLVAGDLYANVARFGNVVTEYIINEYTITSDTNITAAGTVTGQSIVSNTSIVANANITSNGSISAVGNISASYLIASNSIVTNAQVVAGGNIIGNYILGNIPATSIVAGVGTTSGIGGALDSILPSGEISGYVLTTSGPGSYFWSNSGGGGGGGGSIGTKIDTQRQLNVATAGQTVFNLVGGINYTPGSGQLRVYIDGVRQFPDAYTETSNVSFTLSESVIGGTPVLAEIDGYVSYPIAASDISYSPAGGSSIEGVTVQTAITELEVEKLRNVTPGPSGNLLTSNGTSWISSTPTPSPSIGVNQTWQDVSASRAWSTDYTNDTGRPIMFAVTNNANDCGLQLYVGNVLIGTQGQVAGGGDDYHHMSAIVPAGAFYKAEPVRGAGGLYWVELR